MFIQFFSEREATMAKSVIPKKDEVRNSERETTIYVQDCKFFRHQDKLAWSRIRTVMVIEAGLLAIRFTELPSSQAQYYVPLLGGPFFMLSLVTVGAILQLLFFSLSLKDRSDARAQLMRIRAYETENALPAHPPLIVSAGTLLLSSILGISILNVLVLISLRP